MTHFIPLRSSSISREHNRYSQERFGLFFQNSIRERAISCSISQIVNEYGALVELNLTHSIWEVLSLKLYLTEFGIGSSRNESKENGVKISRVSELVLHIVLPSAKVLKTETGTSLTSKDGA